MNVLNWIIYGPAMGTAMNALENVQRQNEEQAARARKIAAEKRAKESGDVTPPLRQD